MRLKQKLWLLFAALCLLGNGAQAHVTQSSSDTETVQLCGLHGQGVVEIAIGDPVPEDSSQNTCCGDCNTSDYASVRPLTSAAYRGIMDLVQRSITPAQVSVGRQLWLGAPPHGPPAIL
ncbi:MAG: hypothetical protein ACFBZ9_12545 [Sphingomonadales bacterium]